MSKKSPIKSAIDKLPDGVKKNISPGEEVITFLKSFVIAERTNYSYSQTFASFTLTKNS